MFNSISYFAFNVSIKILKAFQASNRNTNMDCSQVSIFIVQNSSFQLTYRETLDYVVEDVSSIFVLTKLEETGQELIPFIS